MAITVGMGSVATAQDDPHGLAKIVGIKGGECRKCHPSEVSAWEKSTHALSAARLVYQGNSKKYADALGISSASLATDSTCANCHSTQQSVAGKVQLGGVSCEKCHGGAKDWVQSHGTYFDGMKFSDLRQLRSDRQQETLEHKQTRIAATSAAGMIRAADLGKLAKNCLDCHMIGDEKLIAAGHKAASSFELVSWSGGEVRHNFFMDQTKNSAAPTAWAADTKLTAADRSRLKFVVGTLAQAEAALRKRAAAKNPAVIPQFGGLAAAANGKLAQITGAAPTAGTGAAVGVLASKLGVLFVLQPTDGKVYNATADQIAEQIKVFVKGHDGSKLGGLDSLIKLTPPHYSQQYKQKYGVK
ncbi:MAG: multiheme c-type cytochrome [Planctomycetota bacterium]|nr:multiheme c-type cytochrome [Planctomycetota bacterium]